MGRPDIPCTFCKRCTPGKRCKRFTQDVAARRAQAGREAMADASIKALADERRRSPEAQAKRLASRQAAQEKPRRRGRGA